MNRKSIEYRPRSQGEMGRGEAKNYETKDAVRIMCYAPKVAREIKLDENRDSDDVAKSDVGGERDRV